MEHPSFVRQLSGADIIINPSYDWPGLNPYHAHIAAFRAIETGASVVHHCMVGTSLAVDYRGVVLAHNDHFAMAAQRCAQSTITAGQNPGGGPLCSSSSQQKAAAGLYMLANVPTAGVTTLYASVFGDVLPMSCLALVLYFAVATQRAGSAADLARLLELMRGGEAAGAMEWWLPRAA
jgi:apolipoprotein N-acyltransferase